MKIKKLNLYLDENNKQRFQESNLSDNELKLVENGFEIQKNKMQNPKNIPYIILLKKINNIRNGKTNIFDRTIYFYEKDKEIAKKAIIRAFNQIMIGRNKDSLQNLTFLTEENLNFIASLEKEDSINLEKKKGKK